MTSERRPSLRRRLELAQPEAGSTTSRWSKNTTLDRPVVAAAAAVADHRHPC